MSTWLHHPVRSAVHEAHFLAEVEHDGSRADTPLLAIVNVMLVVAPIGALMMLLAFGAGWLFG